MGGTGDSRAAKCAAGLIPVQNYERTPQTNQTKHPLQITQRSSFHASHHRAAPPNRTRFATRAKPNQAHP
jgi:hypothetical protein